MIFLIFFRDGFICMLFIILQYLNSYYLANISLLEPDESVKTNIKITLPNVKCLHIRFLYENGSTCIE